MRSQTISPENLQYWLLKCYPLNHILYQVSDPKIKSFFSSIL